MKHHSLSAVVSIMISMSMAGVATTHIPQTLPPVGIESESAGLVASPDTRFGETALVTIVSAALLLTVIGFSCTQWSGRSDTLKQGLSMSSEVCGQSLASQMAPTLQKKTKRQVPEGRNDVPSWLACCWRPPKHHVEKSTDFKPSPAGVWMPGSQIPWLNGEKYIHPKYCGLRLQEPSERLPSLDRFPFLSFEDSAAPDAWEPLLRCSDSERDGCRELRARLTDIPGSKDPVTMLRFLRARQGRVDAAADMYASAMHWRAAKGWERGFRLNTMDDTLHRQMDEYLPSIALMGRDHDGDPVYWNRLCPHTMDYFAKVPSAFLAEHEVYVITRLLQALEEQGRKEGRPVMYMTAVVDLSALGLKHINRKALPKWSITARILEDNFPEMVKRVIVVRAPPLVSTVWRVVSKVFDEGTRNKFQIADQSQCLETLEQFINKRWIPEALGGTNHLEGNPYCEPLIPGPKGPLPTRLVEALYKVYPE